MPKFGLVAENSDTVRDALKELRKKAPERVAEFAEEAVKLIRRSLGYNQSKPAKRAGQTYVRTFTMMSNYSTGAIANGYYFKAAAPYSGYVLGDAEGKRQAGIHIGRWQPLARDLFDTIVKKLPLEVIRALRVEIGELGIKEK